MAQKKAEEEGDVEEINIFDYIKENNIQPEPVEDVEEE